MKSYIDRLKDITPKDEPKEVQVMLGWYESTTLLSALRHPREVGSKEVLKAFADRLGEARLQFTAKVVDEETKKRKQA